MNLATSDIIVFLLYFGIVASYGYWIYQKRKSKEHDSKAFFLAEGSLTWWAIGASLIASNISAEQFIGMSGNGYFVGIAVAAYEWIAAVALIIIAIWFMPVYLKNKIYTMPQFLKTRYNESVSVIMAVFWLFLYVFVNLTSILFLGSVAISGLVGPQYFHLILIILAAFAIVITLGGMKVIGYTDVIQVIVLIIGGLVTVFIALDKVSGGNGVWSGFAKILQAAPDHFHLILSKPDAASTQEYINKYLMLPGILMYAAGQWIANLNYWGCNQYITQRALGADLPTARKGLVFAAFLKILMPIIVMLPGIAAFVLVQQGDIAPLAKQDDAYASVLGFLPEGLKGLSVAALTAAIVASLAGKANSISTIFTLDIYKKYISKQADEKKLVLTGRVVVLVSMLIAIFFTWEDLLGIGGEGGFTFIQKYTGFISPGVFAMFLLGLFWKRTTGAAAVAGLLIGFGLSVFFNEFAPQVLGNETLLYTAFPNGKGGFEIPFLIAMGLAFLFAVLVMVVISLAGPKDNPKAFALDKQMFKISPSLMALITVVLMLIAALYIKFW
ncbi:MAG: Sodium/glucose cotransporter [Bacteroidetes bacterium ADurb.BinA245]|jgi:SSS family solute:Na+ symporter|nr:MAG: Sodium/glucose cotransporter [Bacteroidetes bacterium ADurb.BinA245]HMW66458.1 sodium/solute symporter [Chitinophagaceae bacterium]HNA96139.1 sodium/solute symporter [Chitinophagaceae bacterium]HND95304.1 sodium/solute symporter [Chitinophagaceae bacterium]HNJ25383.1 sodium/solute symporter [Chitinophagaceae bacterium]